MVFTCRLCHVPRTLDISPAALAQWQAGTLIQNAFPDLTPGDRELIQSGICEACFDVLFG
jgi:hypothetical protein